MSKLKTGIKVVAILGGVEDETHSFIKTDPKTMVRYIKNKQVKPHKGCGPMCVFRTLKQAKYFVYNRSHSGDIIWHRMYKCKYIGSIQRYIWERNGTKIPLSGLPPGTVLASEVTLYGKPL